jgi:hypothetical protein
VLPAFYQGADPSHKYMFSMSAITYLYATA